MKQYLVGKKLMDFTEIIYIAPDGNDNNDGLTEAYPKATVANALATLYEGITAPADVNPALVFLKGEYHLPTIATNNNLFVSRFYSEAFNCNYIGQGKDTIIHCDNVNNSITKNGRCIIYGAAGKFYRIWFKINPFYSSEYSDVVGCLCTSGYSTNFQAQHEFYNCAFENISSTPKTRFFNLSYGGISYGYSHKFVNCVAKTSYTWIKSSQWNYVKIMENCLVDRAPDRLVESLSNCISRTVTNDDLLTGSAPDITNAKVGVYTGDYCWGTTIPAHRILVSIQAENGAKLQEDSEYLVDEGKDFSMAAHILPWYSYVGYMLDGGQLEAVSPVVITDVRAGHNIVLIYKEKAATGDGSGVPAGMVMYFTDITAPEGWLECDGSAVSRSAYQNLFNVVGTKFGAGDGTTTFNLPDLQGEFVRGFDKSQQIDPNRQFASKQKATVQAFDPTKTSIYMIGLYNTVDDDASKFTNMIGAEVVDINDYPGVAAAGTDSGTSVRDDEVCFAAVRPRNIALLPCIKY